jgi:hypothetical protein
MRVFLQLSYLLVVLGALLLLPRFATATPTHHVPGHHAHSTDPVHEPHHDPLHIPVHKAATRSHAFHNVLAAKFIGMTTRTTRGSEQLSGTGIVYERTVIPHWLELEFSAAALFGNHHHTVFPMDILFKKPFHVASMLDFFIGVGPALSYHVEEHELFVGAIASAGCYVWLGNHLGLLFEVDYALIPEHGAVHEFEGASGIAWRFE